MPTKKAAPKRAPHVTVRIINLGRKRGEQLVMDDDAKQLLVSWLEAGPLEREVVRRVLAIAFNDLSRLERRVKIELRAQGLAPKTTVQPSRWPAFNEEDGVKEVDRLQRFILSNFPGEPGRMLGSSGIGPAPGREESAVEVAMRLLSYFIRERIR